MIKISRISSPLKDKIKNIDTCSQLDGDGVFEGKYATSGTIVLKNKFIGSLKADQTIVDTDGIFEGELQTYKFGFNLLNFKIISFNSTSIPLGCILTTLPLFSLSVSVQCTLTT